MGAQHSFHVITRRLSIHKKRNSKVVSRREPQTCLQSLPKEQTVDYAQDEFNRYQTNNTISMNGIVSLMSDLHIDDISSLQALWVAWKFNAKNNIITLNNFKKCFDEFHMKKVTELVKYIPQNPLDDRVQAKRLFIFSFDCNIEYGQKRIGKDDCIEILDQFFGRQNAQLNRFIRFLKQESVRPLSRDEWQNLFDLIETVQLDFLNYSTGDDSCWPLIFESYYNYCMDNKNYY
ncbi:hypothetical protein EIN_268080 [Entamoeba invadens IP1]|uniref:Defective in cullin neddylation protein n=1 Tax=Entamoeba invadens IP1 TaxID=370355 RepID=A0A0A1UBM0_ENTIV|nr:hypothetical protein EIN_268080 [Entamoeba invadens IP1]ELP91072.1 hypothetical protein EIN_268080 [Entamoeba invadens IP1]|eukprot:XP_004257843.1 hypothetical protein EIN_268080 [Entamoeba invadens IP1]